MLTILQCINTTLVISKWGTFSRFSFLVILLLVLSSNFIVVGVESSRWYPVLDLNVFLFSILFTYIIIEGLSVTASCFFLRWSKIILNIWYRIWFIKFILSKSLSNSLWGSDVLLFPEFINIVFTLFYNFIQFLILFYNFLVIYFAQYREYIIFLVSFSKFSDTLPAFTCARAIGHL